MECLKCRKEIPDGSLFCMFCGSLQEAAPKRHTRKRGNGAGTAYKRGDTWTAAYTVGYYVKDGKAIPKRVTRGGFPTKTAALEYVPHLKRQAGGVAVSQPENEPDTVAALFQTYSNGAMKKLSDSKVTAYNIAYDKLSDIYARRIGSLTIDELQLQISRKASSYYTAKDIQNLLSHLYKLAIAQRYADVNLARYLVLPDLVVAEQKPFVKAEIETLWRDYEAGNVFTGYILLMCYTGMMPGELLAARKENINWERREITGCGKKTATRKETPIVIADFMSPVLESLCEYSTSEKLLCMNKDNFYKRYYETLERLGIERRTPYACRHTAATELTLEGVSLAVVKNIMRHSRLASTQHYVHVDTAPMREALNALMPGEKSM